MALLLAVVLVLVLVVAAAAVYFVLLYSPRLGDDWPKLPACRVKERQGDWPALPLKRLKHITASEFRTLNALCDTILPAFEAADVPGSVALYLTELLGNDDLLEALTKDLGYYTRGALDADVPVRVGDVIETHVRPDAQRVVCMVFKALEMPLGLLFLTGKWYGWRNSGFSQLPFRQREDVIGRLLTSYVEPIRGLTIFIKAMTGRIYFGARDHQPDSNNSTSEATTASSSSLKSSITVPSNPAWVSLCYEDRTPDAVHKLVGGAKALPKPKLAPLKKEGINPSTVGGGTDVRELNCDVVIVGSGAGGGTAAGVLTAAGLDVVVLEKGGYYTESDFAHFGELDGDKALYERAGWFGSEQLSISILAGSCVGGGTTLNWCASFRTPKHVREDWVTKKGLASFGEPAYDEALDAVARRLNVNTHHSHCNDEVNAVPGLVVNSNNETLWQGAKTVGASCQAIPRNVKGCKDCSGCERGCPYGAKQSTMKTFLEDAQASGKLRLVAHAHVDKVLRSNDEAVGVLATVQGEDGKPYQLVVWANSAVVASAGSLHTPALLLRSGLTHDKIGRHLALHPVAAVGGLFPGRYSNMHKGVGMGTYVPDFMGGALKDGYGGAIETPPSHAGLAGVIAPFGTAFNYRMWALLKSHFAVSIVISRDESSASNRVVVDAEGVPRVHYLLSKRDRDNLQHSVEVMLRMVKNQGAKLALPVNEGFKTYRPHRDETNEGQKDAGFEAYLKYLRGMGTPVANTQLFTAHQMCSCRMSVTPEDGPVQETGETWEVKSLYVMDASVFPTSLGINPMITVEAIAFLLSKRLASKLKGEAGTKAIEAKYCQPTPEEAKGKVSFPEGPTREGHYCAW